ncbi:MAG TPA: hypothetical protein PK156_38510, partial [Polyangium sp.]|nr:hypothetical protein [Polyangium sp.]
TGCSYSAPDIEGLGGAGGADGLSSSSGSGTAGMHPAKSIPCGTEQCVGDGEACCLDPDVPENSACFTGGTCTSIRAQCDGPEDCANGEICCGYVDFSQVALAEIKCSSSCVDVNRVMCSPNNSSSSCSSPMQCRDDGTIAQPGYGYCTF